MSYLPLLEIELEYLQQQRNAVHTPVDLLALPPLQI